MQQVKYVPAHGEQEPMNFAGIELVPGVATTVSDEDAAILLKSQLVVDASNDLNPNFICKECGKEVEQDGSFDLIRARQGLNPIVSLVDADGQRTCPQCLNKPVVPHDVDPVEN